MADQKSPKPIRISVRNLVEFVLRSGDLDNRRTFSMEKDAMQEGSRIHRKIQKRMGPSYEAEVFLRHSVSEGAFDLVIEGRADGVITEASGVTIDEIKGVYCDMQYLDHPVEVHLAQAKCYAYIYGFDHGLPSAGIQMTYCNMETEEIRRFLSEYSFEELDLWFQGLVHEYVKWAEYLYHHGLRRNESLKELPFPYAYRKGQKELAVDVYRTIVRKRNLFIQAPTGIGKTLSTVYPSLKAIGEGYGEKLFYLTAKTITRSVAEDTFAILRGCGAYLKTVTITAKEKMCLLEKPECNPESCSCAKGHYDRINDAVFDIIHGESAVTREVILNYAKKHHVCPFEFCLDISNWVDGIICDYNYVFDPNVRLRRYFADGIQGDYLFLADEAHNLVSRAREMYSAVLIKEDVLLAKRILKDRSPKTATQLERCNKLLLEMKRECEGYAVLEQINLLVNAVMTMFGELERFMELAPEFEDRDLVLDFYFQVRDFLNIYDRFDEHYRIYTEFIPDGRFQVKLLCIDPSANLKQCFDQGISTVFFSATLLPVLYYKKLLSGNTEDYAIYAESPFPEENRLLLVASDVSSRYTRRGKREYEKIIDYIRKIVRGRTGNYMVFFPSYQYMKEVASLAETIEDVSKEFTCLIQEFGMKEQEREAFLGEFELPREKSLVAFCVMGGVFSEGIDLKEERLIGAVIVGTGLPMVCTEQEILKTYFDEKEQHGFDYAYQYPGMNKVMQAAGRVIRTGRDRGIIALLDERFLNRDYQALFPKEWSDYKVVTQRTAEDAVKQFWSSSDAGRTL